MKHELKTEELQERAAIYALGALSQHEARAFENHLREQCKVCEEEVAAFAEAVGQIGLSVEAQSPPDYLRDLLLSRIEKEADQQSRVIRFPEQSAAPSAQAESSTSNKRVYLRLAVAASLALMAAAAILFWRQAVRLQNELEQAKSASSSSLRMIRIDGQEAAPQSSGNIYWDVEKNRWVVAVTLPPLPAGKVYQLWFVTPEAKISAGLIRTDSEGKGAILVEVPRHINKLAAAAITLEPEGGSEQPTMPIYALGKT
ncbi:MAG: anti-sigma factor [Acidobacteriota bacterium]